MPNDPEALRARLAKAREARKAKAAAAAVAEPEPQGDDPIAELMATLQKVQAKKAGGAKALTELADILDRIDPKEHPEIIDNPVIEAFLEKIGQVKLKQAEKQGLPPGSVLGNPNSPTAQDVIWKLSDVNKLPDGTQEMMTWTPAETIPLFYQGVPCQCIADVEMTTPKAFYDIYVEHRRLMREAEVRKAWMFGKSSTPPPGEGRDGTTAAATVRAFMGMGGEGGGGRILVGYPGDARFDLRDVPGGGEQPSGETTTQQ